MFILDIIPPIRSQFESAPYTKPAAGTASADESNAEKLGLLSRQDTKPFDLKSQDGLKGEIDKAGTSSKKKLTEVFTFTKLLEAIEKLLAQISGNEKPEAPTVAKDRNDDKLVANGENKSDKKDKMFYTMFALILTALKSLLGAATQEQSTTLTAASKGNSTSPTSDVPKMKTTPPLEGVKNSEGTSASASDVGGVKNFGGINSSTADVGGVG